VTGTFQAGLGYLALAAVCGVLFIRFAVTGGQPSEPRTRRPRPVDEYTPACFLIPARQYTADCPDCGSNITIYTAAGGGR
jgi:hypothetical protein